MEYAQAVQRVAEFITTSLDQSVVGLKDEQVAKLILKHDYPDVLCALYDKTRKETSLDLIAATLTRLRS